MPLRQLPSVDALANQLPTSGLPRLLVVEVARQAVSEARRRLEEGEPVEARELAEAILGRMAKLRPTRVINATGVLLHTNLGRAPLSEAGAAAWLAASSGYANLELDLESGERGGRAAYVHALLTRLTGAEAALAVNNNAGALFLTLAALAAGDAVPVSRGELIEIGGSYRLPELIDASGARLVEVGTTNRTRPSDYRAVAEAALLLKVHPSNYRVEGFVESASLTDLAILAAERGIPLVFDAGSGLLDANVPWLPGPPPAWLGGEPGVRQALAAGADLVLFSGDKLLGGPQAGIVVGRESLVTTLARHPVARALRCSGPALAALAATLELYADGRGSTVPFWQMATTPADTLRRRCQDILTQTGLPARIVESESVVGAGSVPGASVPSPVLEVLDPPADRLWPALLGASTPVVARREAGAVRLDLRAVATDDDRLVAAALVAACRS